MNSNPTVESKLHRFFGSVLIIICLVVFLATLSGLAYIYRKEKRAAAQPSQALATQQVPTFSGTNYFPINPGMSFVYAVKLGDTKPIGLKRMENKFGITSWRYLLQAGKIPADGLKVAYTVVKMLPSAPPIDRYEVRIDRDDIGYFSQCEGGRFEIRQMQEGTNFIASFLMNIEQDAVNPRHGGLAQYFICVGPGAVFTDKKFGDKTDFRGFIKKTTGEEQVVIRREIPPQGEQAELVYAPFREWLTFEKGVGLTILRQEVFFRDARGFQTSMEWHLERK